MFNDSLTKYAMTPYKNFAARVFDVGSYKCLATFVGHEREISKGTFNPSGKRVATASSDKTVRIWDINSGKCLQVLFINGIVGWKQ